MRKTLIILKSFIINCLITFKINIRKISNSFQPNKSRDTQFTKIANDDIVMEK